MIIRLLTIAIILFSPEALNAKDEFFPPAEYIQAKLMQNDIVFLGTTHKKTRILKFIAGIIPTLGKHGVTHIGLEIPSDQQVNIDAFMETGQGLKDIELFFQIDCPEYRSLFHVLKESGGPAPVALDLPYSKYEGNISRDEWIANKLLEVINSVPAAKILVFIGGLHVLKKLEWEEHVPNKYSSIREYIQQKNPSVKMWSICQLIDKDPNECDFFSRYSSLPGVVALDVGMRHRGWKIQFQSNIAILPAECFELVDGVIVY